MRLPIIIRRRRSAADPKNHDSTKLIHAANRGAGIVDGRRHCAQGDVHDLNYAELDVLLHCARWSDIKGSNEMVRMFLRYPLCLCQVRKRNAGRHELADTSL